jgi:hypothetical protein
MTSSQNSCGLLLLNRRIATPLGVVFKSMNGRVVQVVANLVRPQQRAWAANRETSAVVDGPVNSPGSRSWPFERMEALFGLPVLSMIDLAS